MKTVRVGIIGTGSIVRSAHLPALAANRRTQVVALGNLRGASLAALAREFQIAKTYTDLDLIAHDQAIDAVVVALPNSLHAPATICMLSAGKDVLCEKPMATTVADAHAMADAADANKRKLMIGFVWRMHAQMRWLRQIVLSGRIGTIERIKAHAVVAGRGPQPGSWFVDPRASGGGALADVGVHAIDAISFLFDDRLKPLTVSANIDNRFRPLDVEDSAGVRIEYDNHVITELEAGWYHDRASDPHGALEVWGSDGYARILPARLRARSSGRGRDEIQETADLSSAHPDSDPAVYAAQMDHFLACILENRRPACDGRIGLSSVLVVEAAYRSARSGEPVRLEWPSEPCAHGAQHAGVGPRHPEVL